MQNLSLQMEIDARFSISPHPFFHLKNLLNVLPLNILIDVYTRVLTREWIGNTRQQIDND